MRLLLVAVFLTGCNVGANSSDQSITIYAATSLTDVLNELVHRFDLKYPEIEVHTQVGPTSLLARQIELGAPADIFMAASPEWTHFLSRKKLLHKPSDRLAGNTLVVIAPQAADMLRNLSDLMPIERIVLADPSHVPAGVYAKKALQCAGLWEMIEPKVIPAMDARSALTAVMSGAAEFAVVYGSDSRLSPELKTVFQIPESCTPEINYMISVLSRTSNPELARVFMSFATDSIHHSLWTQLGFSL